MPNKHPDAVITVAAANEEAARKLFLAAGFTDFKVTPREPNNVSFEFWSLRGEDEARLPFVIPREMYAYQGVVLSSLPKFD